VSRGNAGTVREGGGGVAAGAGRAGLLAKLMAAVRPEFRVDVLVPDPDDPVLGTKRCAVPGCGRPECQRGLCSGHGRRWRALGQPPVEEFTAGPGPALRDHSQPGACTVRGCRYGISGVGLCRRHRRGWQRAGQPDPAAWAAGVPAVVQGRAECRLPSCALWVDNDNTIFCKGHTVRWRKLGSP
jgi:hypothetical protein